MTASRLSLFASFATLCTPFAEAQLTYDVIAIENQQVTGEAAGVFYETLSPPS